VTIEELRCALGVEPDDSFLDEEALPDRNYLLSVCCGLIITSEDNDIVRFVHYTTQEYFERARHPQLSAAQRYLAHVCITYLSFSAFSKESFLESTNKGSESSAEESGVVHQRRRSDELGRVKDSISLRSREHVLLDYAAQYWGTHAREAIRRDPAINAMVTKFLAKKANVFNSMAVLYCDDDNLDNVTLQRFYYQSIPRNATNLHVAATFGLESLTLELLDEGALLDTRDSEGRTALHSSSVHGHTVVAQMLLDKGANPNLKDRQGSDALWYAAAAGHEPVVRLLLSNGQVLPAMERIISHAASKGHSRIIQIMLESVKDVTIKTTYLESAITRASGTGQEDWVRLLLDLGKDLERDVMRLYLGKALLHAASSNNCVIMQLLLEQGADVNHKAGNKATPLHVAAFSGGKEAVVYLLDNGAEIESAGRKWNRPIHDAMNGESEEVLVILLERGADVNAYVWDNWTPLIVASAKGDANLIPHLLRHGADVEARDKTFNRTAIQRAVLEGHVSAVQMLLTSQYSASMKEGLLALTHYYHVLDDNPDREDDQPDVSQLLLNVQNTFSDDLKKLLLLHRPSSKGDEATVRTFIAMGADINASSYDGDTALHRAAGKGHLKIVRLLLDHGALLEASYNRSGEIPGITPLGSAVEKNHYNTVQLLLDEGADIEHDARWSCGTPLMGAACESNFDIARLLLEHGADPNTKSDSDFGANALDAALNEFRPDLISLNYIQLLIKKGANIEAKNDYGETALCTAVTHGWVEAVSLLLEYGADPNAVQETTEPWDEFTYEEDFSNSMQLIRDAKQRQAEDPERLASENVM